MHRTINLCGVTLTELLITVVVVAILATIAIPNFEPLKERGLDKEAQTNLRLLIAAERMYRMESSGYYASSNITDINDALKLSLPESDNRSWDYATTVSPCAQASRVGQSRTWKMELSDTDPVVNTTCP